MGHAVSSPINTNWLPAVKLRKQMRSLLKSREHEHSLRTFQFCRGAHIGGANGARQFIYGVIFAFGVAAFCSSSAIAKEQANTNDAMWAAKGKSPWVSETQPTKDIWAPNGKVTIRYNEQRLSVVGKTVTQLSEIDTPATLIEILWAPDSSAFVVNSSDGGLVGGWSANYYSLDSEDRPTFHDIGAVIAPFVRDLPHDCEVDEDANFGAAAWLKGKSELLVVAQVPPHSICKNMGAVRGFRVSTSSWKVIEQLTANELRKKWKTDLGGWIH
jgi:hypothetical protein